MSRRRPSWVSLQRVPLIATLLFAGFSTIWILFSDHLLVSLVTDTSTLALVSSLKGLFYVLLAGAGIFVGTRRGIQRALRQQRALAQEQELQQQRLALVVDRLQVLALMLDEQFDLVRTIDAHPSWETLPMAELLRAVKRDPQPDIGWKNITIVTGAGRRQLKFAISAISPHRNDPARYLCLVRDVSDLYRLKEEHRQTHTQLQALIDTSPIGIAVVDRAHRIQYWSRSTERILGYTADEVVGKSLTQAHREGARHIGSLLKGIKGGAQLRGELVELPHRNGGRISLRLSAAPLTASGGPDGYLILVEDLSEERQLRESLGQYRLLTEHSQDLCFFLSGDGRILDANPAAVQFYGYSLEELRQRTIYDLRPDAPDTAADRMASVQESGIRFETIHRKRSGEEAAVEVSAFAAERNGQRVLVCMVRDITERRQQQAVLGLIHRLDQAAMRGESAEALAALAADRQSLWLRGAIDPEDEALVERRVESALAQALRQQRLNLLEAALRATANGVVITDRNGTIEWINPAFTALTGYTADEAVGQTPRIVRSGVHPPAYYQRIWATIQAGRVWQGEIRNRRKDGTLYDEEMTITPIRDASGEVSHYIAVKNDLTQRNEREAQIERLRTIDPTTGLMNRARLFTLLNDLQIGPEGVALVVLDIDQLQNVNQSLGYWAGDQILVHVANMVSQVAENRGLAARIGEDEFAMVIRGSVTAGQAAADRVREMLAADPPTLSNLRVEIPISAGIAPFEPVTAPGEVQLLADQALDEAKRLGGNRSVIYTQGLTESENLVQWAVALKESLRTGGFELHYQPVVCLENRKFTHAEALIRMHSADGTLLPPSRFLPIAERLHLISQIDQWVISAALERLRALPSLRLFLNLSGQALNDMSLLVEIRRRLEHEPALAGRLTLEITETTAIRSVAAARAWMSGMRALGVSFALDDFGTGFASFAYLRSLPVDYVKLDGSFVRGIEADPANQAVVRSVIDVAHSLGIRVVAEWVESEQVADLLREMGVGYGQGFGLAEPSPDLSWVNAQAAD